jgi:hypothetical protein
MCRGCCKLGRCSCADVRLADNVVSIRLADRLSGRQRSEHIRLGEG